MDRPPHNGRVGRAGQAVRSLWLISCVVATMEVSNFLGQLRHGPSDDRTRYDVLNGMAAYGARGTPSSCSHSVSCFEEEA